MKKYFLKLYQYNAWANDRVLSCLQNQGVKDEKVNVRRVSETALLNCRLQRLGPYITLWIDNSIKLTIPSKGFDEFGALLIDVPRGGIEIKSISIGPAAK